MDKSKKILTYLRHSWEALLSLFFPPLCLYCKVRLTDSRQLFCRGCAAYFELIYPPDYCPHCGGESDNGKACIDCVQKKCWRIKCGAALENMDPPRRLIGKISRGEMDFLIKTAASFMVIQYFSFKWKRADYLIALRLPIWKRLFLGMDPAFQLACYLSKSLHIPRASLWNKKKLIGKRVLFIDLTLEKLDSVKAVQEKLELKEAFLFGLLHLKSAKVGENESVLRLSGGGSLSSSGV